jgi:hypothetical protein
MKRRFNKFRIGSLCLFVGGWDVKEFEDWSLRPKYYKIMQNCIIISINITSWNNHFAENRKKKDVKVVSWNVFLQNDGVFIEAYPADLRKIQRSPFRRDHKRKINESKI